MSQYLYIYITIYTYLQTPVTSEGNLGHKHDNWQLTSDSKTYLSDFRGEEKNIKKNLFMRASTDQPAWTCDILRHPATSTWPFDRPYLTSKIDILRSTYHFISFHIISSYLRQQQLCSNSHLLDALLANPAETETNGICNASVGYLCYL